MCLGRIGNDTNGRLCFQAYSIFGHVSYLNWIIFTDPTHIYLHGIRSGYPPLSFDDGLSLLVFPRSMANLSSLQCRKWVHVAVLHRFTIITDVQSRFLRAKIILANILIQFFAKPG